MRFPQVAHSSNTGIVVMISYPAIAQPGTGRSVSTFD
jgi:hypothetical protein